MTAQSLKTKKFPAQRHFLAVFLFSFVWGVFGVDRMYLGKWWTGILKLLTAGGVGVWILTDLWLIMTGRMRDAWGRELLQFNEYKVFARKTTSNFALIVLIVVVIGGAIVVQQVVSLVNKVQGGGLTELIQKYGGGGVTQEQIDAIGNGGL